MDELPPLLIDWFASRGWRPRAHQLAMLDAARARNHALLVSATGAGEFFIREGAAHEICARMRLAGEGARQAADTVMAEIAALGGSGGVIVVSPEGEADWSFNTPGMYRGKASAAGRTVAIYGDEG